MVAPADPLVLHLGRDQIAKAFKDDPNAVKTIEKLVSAVNAMIRAGGFVAVSDLAGADDAIALVGSPKGARTTITDSTLPATGNFGATIVGGGVESVPAWFDGTVWRIG
jgi:hypothetical protein